MGAKADHPLLRNTSVPTTFCAQDPLFAHQVSYWLDTPFVMGPTSAAMMHLFTSSMGQAPAANMQIFRQLPPWAKVPMDELPGRQRALRDLTYLPTYSHGEILDSACIQHVERQSAHDDHNRQAK